jgi:hypothetical protein
MNRNPRRAYDEQGNEIQPITVGWLRKQDMHSVAAYCEATSCGHTATLPIDGMPDELPVPDVSLKLRCSLCGSRSIHTRPNWSEMKASGLGRHA